MPASEDMKKVATDLLTKGPTKTYPTSRRIRLKLSDTWIADTKNNGGSLFVWAPFPANLFLPLNAFEVPAKNKEAKVKWNVVEELEGGNAVVWNVSVEGGKSTDRVIEFRKGDLRGLVRVDFAAIDEWFEEDLPIAIRPRDPYKRIDILPSSRPIKISLNGHLLAASPWCFHMHETGLKVRYYMPFSALQDSGLLKHSDYTSRCPYKGTAEWYHVALPGKDGQGEELHENLVWYYRNPFKESEEVRGMMCFYDDKCEVEVGDEGTEPRI